MTVKIYLPRSVSDTENALTDESNQVSLNGPAQRRFRWLRTTKR